MIVFKRAENLAFDIKDTIQFCQELVKQNPEHAFLTAFWENWGPSKTLQWADNFLKQNNIPVTWIINHWSKDDPAWKTFKNRVIFFDFFLWRVYNEVVLKAKSEINLEWNHEATQYLFLTGKPYKLQRIGLLYELYERGLLGNCNYSLFMDPGMYDKSKKLFPSMPEEEFRKFVDSHIRDPDNAVYLKQTGDLHCGGVLYDKNLYSTSLFKVISETSVDYTPPYITEKTWLTILNCNPFIIAGDVHSCKHLQSRGIKTFDKIFDIPTYDDVADSKDRLQQVIAHIEQWLSGNFDKTEINNMVNYNYNRFIELALQEKDYIERTTGHSIDLVIDTRDFLTGVIE